jgi:sugar phosphate isomerase/epimerase
VTGDSFRQLAEHGKAIDVKILIENHGGYSSDPDNIVAIIKHVDSPFCGALPDFGNMPRTFTLEQRLGFLKKLYPHAGLVSAKGMVFDEEYRHQSYDVGACVKVGEEAGFKGIYSVELWAPGYYPADPFRAIQGLTRTIAAHI